VGLFLSIGLHVCFCAHTRAILVTVALLDNQELGIVTSPALIFLLRIALAMWSFWCFHVNFRIVFSISVENNIGVFMELH
jgi:hypothetical protein